MKENDSKYIFEQREFQRPLSDSQKVVEHFLNTSNQGRTFWPRELKICKKLIGKYPAQFLYTCPQPFLDVTKRLPSLAWFLTKNGEEFLDSHFFEYKKKNTNLINLTTDKIGEDVQISQKPKTLKDFLNLYGKNNEGKGSTTS